MDHAADSLENPAERSDGGIDETRRAFAGALFLTRRINP